MVEPQDEPMPTREQEDWLVQDLLDPDNRPERSIMEVLAKGALTKAGLEARLPGFTKRLPQARADLMKTRLVRKGHTVNSEEHDEVYYALTKVGFHILDRVRDHEKNCMGCRRPGGILFHRT